MNSITIDKLGICASLLCMIHCLALPLLLFLGLDAVLLLIDQPWIETTIIATSLVVGLIAFARGYLQHRQHFISVLFIAGFLLVVNGEAIEDSLLALILSLCGACIIAYAHLQNQFFKRRVREV